MKIVPVENAVRMILVHDMVDYVPVLEVAHIKTEGLVKVDCIKNFNIIILCNERGRQ